MLVKKAFVLVISAFLAVRACADLVGYWSFDNTNNLLAAAYGSDAVPAYGSGSSTVTNALWADASTFEAGALSSLAAGDGAIAIPLGYHLRLPVPNVATNHEWAIEMRVYVPTNANANFYTLIQPRVNNDADAALFIRRDSMLGGGDIGNLNGKYTKAVSFGAWHTIAVRMGLNSQLVTLDGVAAITGTRSMSASDYYTLANKDYLILSGDNDGEDGLLYFSSVKIYDSTNITSLSSVTLAADPVLGDSPLTTTLSATLAEAPVLAVRYCWDFDGDGVVDTNTAESSVSHVFPAGIWNATVTVTNIASEHSSASVRVVARGIAPAISLDSVGGLTASSAQISGTLFSKGSGAASCDVFVAYGASADNLTTTNLVQTAAAEDSVSCSVSGLQAGNEYVAVLLASNDLGHVSSSVPVSFATGGACYVATNGNDSAAGTASAPFRTIAYAISAVSAGEMVYVTPGTYGITAEIGVDKVVSILGTTGNPEDVIVRRTSGSVRVFKISADALVAGLTVENGDYPAQSFQNSRANCGGGGIYMTAGTVSNCVIRGNMVNADTPDFGGGVLMDGATALLTDSVISNNYCRFGNMGNAGGVAALVGTVQRCLIAGNISRGGGAGYSGTQNAILRDSVVVGNFGGMAYNGNNAWGACPGGVCGIYNGYNAMYPAVVSNCVIGGNAIVGGGTSQIYDWGGAAAAYATLYNCVITGNQQRVNNGDVVGVLRNCTAYNCLIANNSSATSVGGASRSTLIGCTVVSNTAVSSSSACGLAGCGTILNSIVWGNLANGSLSNYDTASTTGVTYCCTYPAISNEGNISTDPAFAAGGFSLTATSPCVDAGTNAVGIGSLDLAGGSRSRGGAPDLGCYETAPAGDLLLTFIGVSGVTTTSATLAYRLWSLGAGGSSVTIYSVLEGDGTCVTGLLRTVSALGRFTDTFSGLKPGFSYTVSIFATNNLGSAVSSGAVPFIAASYVTGGTVTRAGTDLVHTFASGGTLTVAEGHPVVAEVLLVGGGGAGGTLMGGGGGAGGVVHAEGVVLAPGTYTINVGAGGLFSTSQNLYGGNGASSFLGTLFTAFGGGAGASWDKRNGLAGASGGGGDQSSGVGGACTNGQGFVGGNAGVSTGGGGGGASAAGVAGANFVGGNGGDGVACAITGSTVVYGGGGGGGAGLHDYYATTPGQGGAGGGGRGGALGYGLPVAGTDGLGGGGGGGTYNVSGVQNYGANGGSGVVIVRYTVVDESSVAPAVNLFSVTDAVTATSAKLEGNLLFLGAGATSCDLLAVYGLAPDDLCFTNVVKTGVTSTGAVSGTLTGLAPGQTWYAALVATNDLGGVAVSRVVTFATTAEGVTGGRAGLNVGYVHFGTPYQGLNFTDANRDTGLGSFNTFIRTNDYAITGTDGAWFYGPLPMSNDEALVNCGATDAAWNLGPYLATPAGVKGCAVSGFKANNNFFGMFVYWGYVYLEAGSTYNFGSYFDDTTGVKIDGVKVIASANWKAYNGGSYTCSATGWHTVELLVGQGDGGFGCQGAWDSFGIGWNTNGTSFTTTLSSTPSTGFCYPADPGDGSVFRTSLARGVTLGSWSLAGGTLSATLSFEASRVDSSLYLCYGSTYGGSVTSAWDHVVSLGTIAGSTTASSPSTSVGDASFARFALVTGDGMSWSATMGLELAVLPVLDTPVLSGLDGDTVTVSGNVLTLGTEATSCGVAVEYGSDPADLSTTSSVMSLSAVGPYSRVLTGLVPGRTYYYRVRALNDKGRAATSAVASFTTPAGSILLPGGATATRVQQSVTFDGSLATLGAGTTTISLLLGQGTNESTAIANMAAVTSWTATATGAFTTGAFHVSFTNYAAYAFVCSNSYDGTVWTSGTVTNTFWTFDQATYTWAGGSLGDWNDTNCWTASVADGVGYPSAGAKAQYVAGTVVTTRITQAEACDALSANQAGLDLTLLGSTTNYGLTAKLWIEGTAVRIVLDDVYYYSGDSIRPGDRGSLVLRNGAFFSTSQLRVQDHTNCTVIVSGGSCLYAREWVIPQATNSVIVIDDACLFANTFGPAYDRACPSHLVFRGIRAQMPVNNEFRVFNNHAAQVTIDFEVPVGGYVRGDAAPLWHNSSNGQVFMDSSSASNAVINVLATSPAARQGRGGNFQLVNWNKGIYTNNVVFGTVPHAADYLYYTYDSTTNRTGTTVTGIGVYLKRPGGFLFIVR